MLNPRVGKPRVGVRSKLAIPPRLKGKDNLSADKSTLLVHQENDYSMLTLVQYLSSDMPRFDGTDIKMSIATPSAYWTISGRGRTFLVRRVSTGRWDKDEMFESDLFRPSQALKCLRPTSHRDTAEDSHRYRSLIQELRILRHPPLKRHPNLLRVFDVSWEPDPTDGTKLLPTVSTEFASWGTLSFFLLAMEDNDWPRKRRLLLDVVEGLSALHDCSIVHGDLKMENILVFATESETFPVIAKLSDFGFSLDVSNPNDQQSLVGYTPIWAAPEFAQKLSPEGLMLTDVYSLGFIVWSVAIGGHSPFEELSELQMANSADEQVEIFNFLKDSNEILGLAAAHVNDHSGDLIGDILKCCSYLANSLQLDPSQRNLTFILENLRDESYRRENEKTILEIQYEPLPNFNIHNIQINKYYFQATNLTNMVLSEITSELEIIATRKINPCSRRTVDQDSNMAWRFPFENCTRAAAAAFALSKANIYRDDSQDSIDMAMKWLYQAAKNGHTVAQIICARSSNISRHQPSVQDRIGWLEGAASIGLKIPLLQLKELDEMAYHRCFENFRNNFWAKTCAIPEIWLAALRNPGLVEENLEKLVRGNPREIAIGIYNDSLLHCSAIIGSLSGIELCIVKYGIPINSTNDRMETPLFLACRSGHIGIVQYLLSKGAEAGICNVHKENGLHWLSSFEDSGLPDVVQKLCTHGAEIDQVAEQDNTFFPINTRNYYNQWFPGTPLQRGVMSGNIAAVHALLGNGASLDFNHKGFNAVDRAAMCRHSNILELLLAFDPSFKMNEERAASSGRKLSPIHRAIESVDRLKLLYLHGNYYPYATNDTMSIILSAGIDLRNMTINPLHYAAAKNNSQALKLMLEHQELDIDARETINDEWTQTPLMKAISVEDEDSVEILLRYGASVKAELRFASASAFNVIHLCRVYWHKDTRILEQLIQSGAEVDHLKDASASATPLFYALICSQFPMADLLIRHGASLTVISHTEEYGNVMGQLLYTQFNRLIFNAIKFLAEHPRKPYIPFITYPSKNTTVFHSITMKNELHRKCLPPGDFLAIFALLQKIFPDPCLINIPDNLEFTPLHYAAWNAFPEAVRALLSAGADPFYCAGIQTSGEGDIPPMPRGISVVEMVRDGKVCPLRGFAELVAEEKAEAEQRRAEVRMLLEPYM
ncbi:ankyrin repeat-containing domain protein [Tricladium varicosporioides]|nr:ankyrin repeat-containing domain protein [Hymenoscyphus varicosporioides]